MELTGTTPALATLHAALDDGVGLTLMVHPVQDGLTYIEAAYRRRTFTQEGTS